MNLVEAIKSGRPFRQVTGGLTGPWKTESDLCGEMRFTSIVEAGGKYSNDTLGRPVLLLTLEELVSDAWEIQEPSVEVTQRKLIEAFSAAYERLDLYQPVAKTMAIGDPPITWQRFCLELGRELGLEK